MLLAVASAIAIAYLPGAVLFRWPVADRDRRAALAADERVFWAVLISLAQSTLAALVLGALGSYSLSRLVWVNLLLAIVPALGWRQRLRLGPAARRAGWPVLVPVALAGLGTALFFPSSEYVMGGKDPGTYMNEGVQMAQRGSLTIPDVTLAAVPAGFRDLFLTSERGGFDEGLQEGVRFMGFFVANRERGEVMGQFPHAFPIWIAVGYGLDGLSGARRAVGVWAIVGLLSVYFAGSRLLGRTAAAAACVLLALNVAEVWFARYPNSELMQQALLFAALLALARAYRDADRFFAPVAGVLLGLLLFVRFDSLVILAVVGGGILLLIADARRPGPAFLLPAGLLAAVAAAYYAGPMKAYIAIPLLQAGGPRGVLAGVALLVLAGIAVAALRARAPALTARAAALLPRVLVVLLVIGACYGAFFRAPYGNLKDAGLNTIRQGLAEHDAYSLRIYAWYVGPAAIVAAVLGFGLVAWRGFWRDPVLLSTAVAVSGFFFYRIRIVPEHFWQARRYLPVILPATYLMVAGAALFAFRRWADKADGSARGRERLVGGLRHLALPLVFLTFIGWQGFAATRPILRHVEYAGLIPQLERLASQWSDRDLVIVESRNSSDAHVLATPLAYIYARNVLLLSSPRPAPGAFEQFLSWADAHYDRVLFLADGGTDLGSRHVGVTPLRIDRIEIPEYESVRNGWPAGARLKKFGLSQYRLNPATDPAVVTAVDVGGFDDLCVLRIYAKEQGEGVTYRWTRNISYVSLMGIAPESRALTLWMSNGGRPAAAGAARVGVYLDDRLLGTVTVGAGFRAYSVPLPPEVSAQASRRTTPSSLRLVSTVWKPQAFLGGTDDRELGVMLDRVRIDP